MNSDQIEISPCEKYTFLQLLVSRHVNTVYPKKYAHGLCFAVLCCGYTLTDFPISIRLTSLALWQSNDCPSASKATLMNMDKYFMWIHYERLHNHNKAKHNKTVCIFLGIYCISPTIIVDFQIWAIQPIHHAMVHFGIPNYSDTKSCGFLACKIKFARDMLNLMCYE